MVAQHHTVEGGSRNNGSFFFILRGPNSKKIGTLQRLKSEAHWRVELRTPQRRRIMQLFPTFDEVVLYLDRILPTIYGEETKIV